MGFNTWNELVSGKTQADRILDRVKFNSRQLNWNTTDNGRLEVVLPNTTEFISLF